MTDTVAEIVAERSADLVHEYTVALDDFVNRLVPPTLSNAEYAARCSGLMIALNRQLARCAAAFGEANGVGPDMMMKLVAGQFTRNYSICLDAVHAEAGHA